MHDEDPAGIRGAGSDPVGRRVRAIDTGDAGSLRPRADATLHAGTDSQRPPASRAVLCWRLAFVLLTVTANRLAFEFRSISFQTPADEAKRPIPECEILSRRSIK